MYDFDDTNYNNTKNSERNDDDNSDEQNDSHSNIKSFYESKKSTKKIVKLNSSNCSNKSKFDQIINEKAVLYNSNDKYTEQLVLGEDKIINNSISSFKVTKLTKFDQDNDNGEAEMEAKLKDFSHIIEKQSQIINKEPNEVKIKNTELEDFFKSK